MSSGSRNICSLTLRDLGHAQGQRGWLVFNPTLEREVWKFHGIACAHCNIVGLILSKHSTYPNILKPVIGERLPDKLLTVEHRLCREDRSDVIVTEHSWAEQFYRCTKFALYLLHIWGQSSCLCTCTLPKCRDLREKHRDIGMIIDLLL